MLFDIGWPELLLIGVVALVVIGPKDLPRALRTAGFWVRKARGRARRDAAGAEEGDRIRHP
jgi:sec-independent protein translocase protein TatB